MDMQKLWSRIRTALSHRRIRVLLLAALLLLVLFRPFSNPRVAQTPSDWLKTTTHSYTTAEPTLHILIPATERNPNLCKTILSAAVNGYPTPVLINWGKPFSNTEWYDNGTHIGKLTGISRWLEKVKPEHHDELVLAIDGYDTWFQLPLSVLLSRYQSVNEYLTHLSIQRVGQDTIDKEEIMQSIIFPAQRNCGPTKRQFDEVACYAQPESPLPRNIYGPETDVLDPVTHLPLHMRPHWLNSGLILGPVREMLDLYNRAVEKIDTSRHKGSDQHIFNEIYGEQEYQREVLRLRNLGFLERAARWLGFGRMGIADDHPTHKPMVATKGKKYEFGLGLDYWMEMTASTVLAEWDGNWLTYSNRSSLIAQQAVFGHPNPAVESLPGDIALAPKPFHNLTDSITVRYSVEQPWQDMPLYTNLYTGRIPIMIHMNGFKTMREAIWDRMWFLENVRALLSAYARSHDVGAWTDEGKWLSWKDLCGGDEVEVFRDLFGAWEP